MRGIHYSLYYGSPVTRISLGVVFVVAPGVGPIVGLLYTMASVSACVCLVGFVPLADNNIKRK